MRWLFGIASYDGKRMLPLNLWAKINTRSVTCRTHSSKQAHPNIDLVILKALTLLTRNVSPANYILKYSIMPYVGVLTYGEAVRTSEAIAFPAAQPRQ